MRRKESGGSDGEFCVESWTVSRRRRRCVLLERLLASATSRGRARLSSLPLWGDWVTLKASSHRWLPLLVKARRVAGLENERSQSEAGCLQRRTERRLLALVARGEKARQIAAVHVPHHSNLRTRDSSLSPPRRPSLSHAHFSDTGRSLQSGQAGWRGRGRGTQRDTTQPGLRTEASRPLGSREGWERPGN